MPDNQRRGSSIVDGTNSYGRVGSTNRWTAAKPYGMMDHPLNQLFVWFKVRWSIIGGDVISRDGCRKKRRSWHHGAEEREIDGSQSKIGPTRQPAYLWNAESMLDKIGMGLVDGFRCKKIPK
jgi:hypothetical protein